MVQVDDLMPKLDRVVESAEQRSLREAQEYARKWKRDHDEKVAELTNKRQPTAKMSKPKQAQTRGRKR